MASLLNDLPGTVTPSEADSLAQESSQRLARILESRTNKVRLGIKSDDAPEETIAIPLPAFRLLADILIEMGKGNAITLIPTHTELTTQQAADLLNVSRPFLVELLEKGEIPFHKVGTHRRIRFHDVKAYKQQTDQARYKALEELSALDQELGLGY